MSVQSAARVNLKGRGKMLPVIYAHTAVSVLKFCSVKCVHLAMFNWNSLFFVLAWKSTTLGDTSGHSYLPIMSVNARDKAGKKQGQAGTSRDKQGQGRDKQEQKRTRRASPCLSLLVPTCTCLSPSVPACPFLSLYVPNYPCLSLSAPVFSCLSQSGHVCPVCPYLSLSVPVCLCISLSCQCPTMFVPVLPSLLPLVPACPFLDTGHVK